MIVSTVIISWGLGYLKKISLKLIFDMNRLFFVIYLNVKCFNARCSNARLLLNVLMQTALTLYNNLSTYYSTVLI